MGVPGERVGEWGQLTLQNKHLGLGGRASVRTLSRIRSDISCFPAETGIFLRTAFLYWERVGSFEICS